MLAALFCLGLKRQLLFFEKVSDVSLGENLVGVLRTFTTVTCSTLVPDVSNLGVSCQAVTKKGERVVTEKRLQLNVESRVVKKTILIG